MQRAVRVRRAGIPRLQVCVSPVRYSPRVKRAAVRASGVAFTLHPSMTTYERWRSRWAVPAALVSAVTLFAPATASGHHSFAEYEDMRTSTLEGTVESFQWNNPHVVVKVLVKPDDHTDPQEWNVVTSSPAILTRFGWG